MKQHQARSLFLRTALLANAAFSLSCAVVALSMNQALASILFSASLVFSGWPAALVVGFLGGGLIVFGLFVGVAGLARRIPRLSVIAIIGADLFWVLGSICLLAFATDRFTLTGVWVVGLLALMVFTFAAAQALGLALLYQGDSRLLIKRDGRVRCVKLTRRVAVDASEAWLIMIDHEAYVDVADNLARVEVLDENGKGMSRKCTGKDGGQWNETAHIWEEGRRYGFTIDARAPDYPYPLEALAAVWTVESVRADACDVSIAFDVTPKATLKGAVFITLSMMMFPKLLDRLLERWQARMEASASAS